MQEEKYFLFLMSRLKILKSTAINGAF